MMRLSGALALSFAAFLASFVAPPEARAWGEYGHLTVCDLAYRNFTPEARRIIVDELLRSRAGGIRIPASGDTEARTYTSFNVGCLEEDARPRKHPKDHFVNVPRDTAAITGPSCPLSQATGDPLQCAFAGIERDLAILKDSGRTREQRVIALMALGHWIGDIHQPLHISFKDDAGGNAVRVRFSGNCGPRSRPGKLHAVWDNCLLEAGLFDRVRHRADFRTTWGPRTITYRAVDTLMANTPLSQERQFVAGEPWQWAAESYAITLRPETLYCVRQGAFCRYSDTLNTLPEGGTERRVTVDQAYLDLFKAEAEERVRRAGFRLAHLVNLALDPAYAGPVADGAQPAS